jgi:hypothetical protein
MDHTYLIDRSRLLLHSIVAHYARPRLCLMLRSQSTRRPAFLAVVVVALSGAFAPVANAQLPQPRLTSLSRPGLRVGEPGEITLRGSDLEGVTRLWFDHPGIHATHVKDLTFRVVSEPDVPLGHHDIRAIGTYGISNPRAFVVGDRPESIEGEPNNAPEKANPIVINTVINAELNGAADVDCFGFDGKKGQRLFLDVLAERIDSRLDATIRLLTPSGTELAESRDVFGADPFLDVTLPADGRYVIKVHDATYAGSPDHIYRLTVHQGPHLDAILPAAFQPGERARLTLIGRGLGAMASLDPQLKPEGPVLERMEVVTPIPAAALAAPDPSSPGRMFIPSAIGATRQGFECAHVRVEPAGAAPTVSNPLFVARAVGQVLLEHEPNNDEARAQLVAPPCDITGTFAPQGDVDLFRFQGKKGEIWWIEAFAERIGSMADPTFVIQKAGLKGQPAQDLASGDDLPDAGAGARFNTQTIDAALRWQVPDDGLYQVLVSDLYASQRGDPRLTYRLIIRREEPDFALLLVPNHAGATDAVTVRAGGRTSAYVVAIRKDGFAGAIRVEPRDLPTGVRASAVTIGPGQVVAPIVFEAADTAKPTVGSVTTVGVSHFGDRKEALEYVAGASPLGPDLTHVALAGGMTWPPPGNAPTVAPARLFRGFLIAVLGDPAPLSLSARSETLVAAQGRQLNVDLGVTRRAGFTEAVAVTASDLPPNMPAPTVTIAKDAKTAVLPLFVPRNVPVGVYTIVARGTGAYPFNKDPKAKEKPNVNLTEPSNPITLFVHPAPVSLAVDNKGGNVKQGASLEVGVTITRQNGFAGPVALTLTAPANLRLSALPAVVAENQSQAKLMIQAAKDGPAGAAPQAFVRAVAKVRGEPVEVDEPIALTVVK